MYVPKQLNVALSPIKLSTQLTHIPKVAFARPPPTPTPTMASLSTAAAPSATGTGTCSAVPYDQLPTQDTACAVAYRSPDGLPSDTKDKMSSCCKDADVSPFASDCGLYCLAIGQSVGDLTKCFQDQGINPSWIWCNGNNTATATATSDEGPEETGKDGDKPKESGGESPKPSNAAGRVRVFEERGVSKVGVGMLVMLGAAAFGALL